MCKIMEDIVKKEVAEAVKEAETARKEAETARKKAEEKNFTCLTNMIMLGISKGKLLELGFTEDEYREAYKEAEKALIAKV